MKLTIVRGVPGSGKTTYAKKNFRCLILEQDMYHERDGRYDWKPGAMKGAIAWCFKTAKSALAAGMDVCVVNTFVKAAHVKRYADMAASLGADVEVVRMEGDYGNVHCVPQAVLDGMKEYFQDWPGEIRV